jgi:hypothetical protein
MLHDNLTRALRYGAKALPDGTLDLSRRVLASGPFCGLRARARGEDGPGRVVAADPGAGRSTRAPERSTCAHCGGPIPANARSDAIYCKRSCNTLAWKARRDRDLLADPEVAERSAIAEYDGGLSRAKADRLAIKLALAGARERRCEAPAGAP